METDETLAFVDGRIDETRYWDLWQVETALTCNLNCTMCPWHRFRDEASDSGLMTKSVWNKLIPFLNQVKSVDFTGGGEPILNKNLLDWIGQANRHGCKTGFLTNGLLLNRSLSQELISIGIDWLAVSMDGAEAEVYEKIRRGASFAKLYKTIKTLSELRISGKPHLMINFVIMEENIHQMEDMVLLASNLGVEQINFKQCDVIRYNHGIGRGLFAKEENRKIKQYRKLLARARKRARKLNIKTTAFSFVPDEQPICDQNPCKSMFISYKGETAPCINLAMGGPTEFMGTASTFPTVRYGNILKQDIKELWESEVCLTYKKNFQRRKQIYDKILAGSDLGSSILSLRRAFQDAAKAMPAPPEGCGVCHYLYGI